MKRIFFILILSLFLLSCNKYITTNLYRNTYETVPEAITDINKQMSEYEMGTIPMNEWIVNYMTTDTILIEQRMVKKEISSSSTYTFIFTKYNYPSHISFDFVIRYVGKEKDLEK